MAQFQDRQYRVWTYTHDADRRLTKMVGPLGHQTLFGYNPINELTSLTDPNGNTTTWAYDVEGRLTTKQYVDTSTVTYAYENTTSRLHSITDALSQIKQFSYAQDNRLSTIGYLNAVNPTPNASFTYDTYFPRVTVMTDGSGTTQYNYTPAFSLGALRLQQECFTPTGGSSCSYQINYAYDALERLSSRTVSGAGAETFGYDALGRLISHNSDLGSFTLSYLGQTGQITSRQLANSTLSTTWGYLPNLGDRRLASIGNTGLSAGQYSNFTFTTTPENFITGVTVNSDASAAYPTTGSQTASYNNLNQLTNLSGQALTWDADGNLLSDGTRDYAWDAENRLVAITYPGQPGAETSFAYNALSRRTAITNTAGAMTSYIWCGLRICQARNVGDAVTREYFAEGELVPGSSTQPYYYGADQVGTVRRTFASTTSAPAYAYDPYGQPLQANAPSTDFAYAAMFLERDSGLDLALRRIYNPMIGRWLTRDPFAEDFGPNLYPYAGNNPTSALDPFGLDTLYSVGIGGTGALFVVGAGGSITLGLNVPTNPLNFSGYQVAITGQLQGMGGGGAYLGYGVVTSSSTTSGSLPFLSGSSGWYTEADIGYGLALGGSAQGNLAGFTGGSVSPPLSVGEGYGAWWGLGGDISGTLAFPSLQQILDAITSLSDSTSPPPSPSSSPPSSSPPPNNCPG